MLRCLSEAGKPRLSRTTDETEIGHELGPYLDVAAGKRDQLVGKVQNRYGIAKDEAEKQIDEWAAKHKAAL